MQRKKICYITTVPITIESFIIKIIEYFHENTNWDISVICDEDLEFAKRLPEYVHYFPVKMERGVSFSGIKAMFQMKKIFKQEKFDLIQYSTPNASLYAAIAGKLTKVPVRLYCQWGMAFVGFQGIKRQIFRTLEKLVCNLSTWIEPDSKSNLEFSHEQKLYSKNKSSVIWNGSACGVNLQKFDFTRKEEWRNIMRDKHDIPKDAFVFGFVGRITKDKGINELFAAAKTIIEENKNVYLLMVGGLEIGSAVNEELYQWSKNSKHVVYVGHSKVVEQYLAVMDCYVLPSYREGFGLGVVEAEAMGVPVIVTNIPGPIDAMIKDKTGIVVEKADLESLRIAMKYMMSSGNNLIEYGQNGRKYAETAFEQTEFFRYLKADRERLLNIKID